MTAFLFLFSAFLFIVLFTGGIAYVVCTVREHMSTCPEAAKAIYEHVFIPVFIGVPKPVETKETPDEVSTIDLSDYKL